MKYLHYLGEKKSVIVSSIINIITLIKQYTYLLFKE